MTFLHGIEVIQIDDGLRPVRQAASSVIGLVGTAPGADNEIFPLNEPVLLAGAPRRAARLGITGTLPTAVGAIYRQSGASIVVVRVADENSVVGSLTGSDGVYALLKARSVLDVTPRILCAPGWTNDRPTGIGSLRLVSAGSGYTSAPTVTITAPVSGRRAIARAEVGQNGSLSRLILDDQGSGYSTSGASPQVAITGGGGRGATATAQVAVVPNPVISALLTVARRLRAIVVADAAGLQADYDDAVLVANDWDSDRLYLVHPGVRIGTETSYQAASAAVAGAIARRDNERGYWWSPSNQILSGVTGTGRGIVFSLTDSRAESHLLNERGVAVIVRQQGFRLWGNRTQATDTAWSFLSVRRTADILYDTLENSFLWALDRPFSSTLLEDIQGSVAAQLRNLRSLGAIINGRVWLDEELNDRTALEQGRLYVDFDLEPAAPVERLTFRAHRNGDYYEELVADATAA